MTERLFHKKGGLKRETEAAYLADLDDMDEPIWLPKSQVEYDHLGTFIIPDWLCDKKDIPHP